MKFETPLPDTQINFFHRLEEIKKSMLQEALFETLESADIGKIDRQLRKYVVNSDLQLLAKYGLRGEIIFAVPYLLELNPSLIGYYRLLLGLPQKSFYSGERGLGFGFFKSMESKGTISNDQKKELHECCKALVASASILLKSINEASISQSLFRDLTLLTLGSQLRGGRNNALGNAATKMVFELIKQIVKPAIISSTNTELILKNAAGREIVIKFASDPDIVVIEKLQSGKYKNRIAIEIKGGTDTANAHNRLGEAEKSHQKAKNAGFIECWTLIGAKVDQETANKESPTTNRLYHIPYIMDEDSSEYQDFKENIIALVGIAD